jgi:hypothetical protein
MKKFEIYLMVIGIMFAMLAVPVNAAKWTVVDSFANFTFDIAAELGNDTGEGDFGDLNYSGWASVSTDCIDGNCVNISNDGVANNSYNTKHLNGSWCMWFKPDISSADQAAAGGILWHDAPGANEGDFSVGIQNFNSYGTGGAITQTFNLPTLILQLELGIIIVESLMLQVTLSLLMEFRMLTILLGQQLWLGMESVQYSPSLGGLILQQK